MPVEVTPPSTTPPSSTPPSALPAPPGVSLLDGTGSRGLSMARTLGSEEPDQVSQPGRRVLIGWTGPGDAAVFNRVGSAQSLPRDLSLAPDRSLLQAFVPELKALRGSELSASGKAAWFPLFAGLQAEVHATLPTSCAAAGAECGVSILGDGDKETKVVLSTELGLVLVDATGQGNTAIRGGPMPAASASGGWDVHLYVDHSIIEIIVSNATAFVVYANPTEGAGRVAMIGAPEDPSGARLTAWTLKSPAHAY